MGLMGLMGLMGRMGTETWHYFWPWAASCLQSRQWQVDCIMFARPRKRAYVRRLVCEQLESRLSTSVLPAGFFESLVAGGIAAPTAMAIAPDKRMFVAEQGGKLRVTKEGTLLPDPFLSVPVNSSGERGLLGVAVDPNFAVNNFVYVYYTTATSPVHNRISRFTANGDIAQAGSETVLLELDNLNSATNHNGGAIHFGLDGKLYVGVGDNAVGSNSQSLENLLGKILRINSDGCTKVIISSPTYAMDGFSITILVRTPHQDLPRTYRSALSICWWMTLAACITSHAVQEGRFSKSNSTHILGRIHSTMPMSMGRTESFLSTLSS